MKWFPNAEIVNIPSARQRQRPADQPLRRIVLGTTESDAPSAYRSYTRSCVAPHLTLDPTSGAVVQHLSFENCSYGTRKPVPPALVEGTSIFVALVGHASGSGDWPDEWLTNVGNVLKVLTDEFQIPLNVLEFAGTTTPHRLSRAEFTEFSGICGNQHVPESTRWDPGRINVARIVEIIAGEPEVEELVEEDPTETTSAFTLPEFSKEIKKGSKNKVVEAWQQFLFADEEPTGKFDAATHNATVDFQSRNGLEPTGVVDEETWTSAIGDEVVEEPVAKPKNPKAPLDLGDYPGFTMTVGKTGPVVARWQSHLGLEPTGTFDTKTKQATERRQREVGLQSTGVVDKKTWQASRLSASK